MRSRSRMRSFGKLLAVAIAVATVSTGCSSDSKDSTGSDGLDSTAFRAAVDQTTRAWGKEAAGRFFATATEQFAMTAEIERFNETVSTKLCDLLTQFEPDEDGSLDSKSDALLFSKASAFDGAVAGLLAHAMEAAEPERQQLLDSLGVVAVDPNNPSNKLTGTAALTAVGLLGPDNNLVIPATEFASEGPDGAYGRFRNWFAKQALGIQLPAGRLSKGIDENLDKCETSSKK